MTRKNHVAVWVDPEFRYALKRWSLEINKTTIEASKELAKEIKEKKLNMKRYETVDFKF